MYSRSTVFYDTGFNFLFFFPSSFRFEPWKWESPLPLCSLDPEPCESQAFNYLPLGPLVFFSMLLGGMWLRRAFSRAFPAFWGLSPWHPPISRSRTRPIRQYWRQPSPAWLLAFSQCCICKSLSEWMLDIRTQTLDRTDIPAASHGRFISSEECFVLIHHHLHSI